MRNKVVMSVIGLAVAVAVAMTLPVAAGAKPNIFARFEARQTCISERGIGDPVKMMEFKMLYGRRPMRKCVRMHARTIALERRFELPAIRMECRIAAMTDPEFRLEFPSVKACVRMEMLP
jgi:hypothetical protein